MKQDCPDTLVAEFVDDRSSDKPMKDRVRVRDHIFLSRDRIHMVPLLVCTNKEAVTSANEVSGS